MTAAQDIKIRHYASSNLDRLAADMAEGRGESLATFSYLWEVDQRDQAAFFSFTQENFGALFDHDRVTVGDMIDNMNQLLREDESLSIYARG